MPLTAVIGASVRVFGGQETLVSFTAADGRIFTRAFVNDGSLRSLRAQVIRATGQYEAETAFVNQLVEGTVLDLTPDVTEPTPATAEELIQGAFLKRLGRLKTLRAIDPTSPQIAALSDELRVMITNRPALLDLVIG